VRAERPPERTNPVNILRATKIQSIENVIRQHTSIRNALELDANAKFKSKYLIMLHNQYEYLLYACAAPRVLPRESRNEIDST
jgi:hypothetical protein